MDETGCSLWAPFHQKANKLHNQKPLWSQATMAGRTRRQWDGQRTKWEESSPEGKNPQSFIVPSLCPGTVATWMSCVNENSHASVSQWSSCARTHTHSCTSINVMQLMLTSQQSSPDVTEGLFNVYTRAAQLIKIQSKSHCRLVQFN